MSGPRPRPPKTPEAVERIDLAPQAPSASLARRFIRQVARQHLLAGEVVDRLGAQLDGAPPLPPGEECLVS
jgi:hypothetical protein